MNSKFILPVVLCSILLVIIGSFYIYNNQKIKPRTDIPSSSGDLKNIEASIDPAKNTITLPSTIQVLKSEPDIPKNIKSIRQPDPVVITPTEPKIENQYQRGSYDQQVDNYKI